MDDLSSAEIISKYANYINFVRQFEYVTATLVQNQLKVSNPTANQTLNRLVHLGVLLNQDKMEQDERKKKKNTNYFINPRFGYFLGIAVGTSEIKVVILDFNFNPILENDYIKYGLGQLFEDSKGKDQGIICYPTEHDIYAFCERLCSVLRLVLEAQEKQGLKLLGIGFAFPGAVDCVENKIISSPNLDFLNGLKYTDIIDDSLIMRIKSQEIAVIFDNNANAGVVAEKTYLYKSKIKGVVNNNYSVRNKRNVAAIYLGTGLGLGLVINNQLYRGSSNFVGEIGHVQAPFLETQKERVYCNCGKNVNCLEAAIRKNVFNSDTVEEYRKITEKPIVLEDSQISNLRFYITFILNIIINVLNLDLVVMTGRIINNTPKIWDYMNRIKQAGALSYTGEKCAVIRSCIGHYPIAVGAAIIAYYKLQNQHSNGLLNIFWY